MSSIPNGMPHWPSAVVARQELIPIPQFGQIKSVLMMDERYRATFVSPTAIETAADSHIFAAVVREYDRRVGRTFLALPPEGLPAEARPLLHFGQRRGERWNTFVAQVAGLVEVATCRDLPLIVSYHCLCDLALAVGRGDKIDDTFAVDFEFRIKPIAALLREVIPMTRARGGRDHARRLREERDGGNMAGVPGPVAQAVLGMVEDGVFTEERLRELEYGEVRMNMMRMKTKNGGCR